MLNTLIQFLVFFFEVVIIVAAILIVFAGLVAIASKSKEKGKDKLRITKLNDKYDSIREKLNEEVLTKKQIKKLAKQEKKERKQDKNKTRPRVFLIEFIGDLHAKTVKQLRQEITAILTIATPDDEVVVTIESGGGVVNGYGLAASQLQRVRDKGIPLTVIVDKVAASGGYMMACVANQIYAAPFAILGSIGVLAQIPNFHRLLKDKKIDFEQITAGEYKRTLTLFGENTNQDRHKMQEDIQGIHDLFKNFVSENRPQVTIEQVATGEYWLGTRAYELKLIDKIITSDDYLLDASNDKDIYLVSQKKKKGVADKFSASIRECLEKIFYRQVV